MLMQGYSMSHRKTISDLPDDALNGKVAFVRVDFNVPQDKATLKITDDTRIRAALPTIQHLLSKGAKIVLASHLGRPKGPDPKSSLAPAAERLAELLGKPVLLVPDCIGAAKEATVGALESGQVVLLENVRWHPEEEKNDPEFAKQLASGCDVFVNDAFGSAHRAHASTAGVTAHLSPKVAGFLMQKELDYLVGAVSNPQRPFAAIVGGAKVSSKIGVIESLLEKCDKLILGGGMIFTFFKAKGLPVGASLVEDDKLDLAKQLMEKAASKGVDFYLPSDVIIADKFAADANSEVAQVDAIPEGWMGLDIGPNSIADVQKILSDCKTVIWNGEWRVFAKPSIFSPNLHFGIQTPCSPF
jgi:phosphoglycerate kinase